MKKYTLVMVILAMVFYFTGCSKKHEALEDMQQPMSPEDLSRLNTETLGSTGAKVESVTTSSESALAPVSPTPETKLEKLPPSGPFKPTNLELQTALKNAGLYTGPVDGKIGPLTKKAIEEFQKQNGLAIDGKVGLKTWNVLSKYLNPAPASAAAKPAKKR